MRIAKTVNKLFTLESTCHDTNQTNKTREQKSRREVAVTGEQKRNMDVNYLNIGRWESLNIANINLLIRSNKTREIFPSVL